MAQFDSILEERLQQDINFEELVEAVEDIDTIDILANTQDPEEPIGDPEDDMSFTGVYTPIERDEIMTKDIELLDVLESMYGPEQAILDQELEDIHEAEQALLYGEDEEIDAIIDDDIDTDDFEDDGEESFNVMESIIAEEFPDMDSSIHESTNTSITETELFDEYGVINY